MPPKKRWKEIKMSDQEKLKKLGDDMTRLGLSITVFSISLFMLICIGICFWGMLASGN
jgi:hypothetical protein